MLTIIRVPLSQFLKCKQRLNKLFVKHDTELRFGYNYTAQPEIFLAIMHTVSHNGVCYVCPYVGLGDRVSLRYNICHFPDICQRCPAFQRVIHRHSWFLVESWGPPSVFTGAQVSHSVQCFLQRLHIVRVWSVTVLPLLLLWLPKMLPHKRCKSVEFIASRLYYISSSSDSVKLSGALALV